MSDKRRKIILLCLLAVFCSGLILTKRNSTKVNAATGMKKIIVKYKSLNNRSLSSTVSKLVKKQDKLVKNLKFKDYTGMDRIYVLEVDAENELNVLNVLKKQKNIEYVERDYQEKLV